MLDSYQRLIVRNALDPMASQEALFDLFRASSDVPDELDIEALLEQDGLEALAELGQGIYDPSLFEGYMLIWPTDDEAYEDEDNTFMTGDLVALNPSLSVSTVEALFDDLPSGPKKSAFLYGFFSINHAGGSSFRDLQTETYSDFFDHVCEAQIPWFATWLTARVFEARLDGGIETIQKTLADALASFGATAAARELESADVKKQKAYVTPIARSLGTFLGGDPREVIADVSVFQIFQMIDARERIQRGGTRLDVYLGVVRFFSDLARRLRRAESRHILENVL